MDTNILLQVENLKKTFQVRNAAGKKTVLSAVDDVSFTIERGKTMGLVGESGSGKSTTGRAILRLIEPDAGKVVYDGRDITRADMRPYRRKMQIIFQNPAGSLDPRCRVGESIAEGMRVHHLTKTRAEQREKVEQILLDVGLRPEDSMRYPGEFSGGQQQRIAIARALAVDPEFIVCDEPVSALDVSYQSQIINMLEDLQKKLKLTYLFISHDLSVVMHISDTVGVMYLGRMMEYGTGGEVVLHPAHPYTKALLAAIPVPDPKIAKGRTRQTVALDAPRPKSGCPFFPRCAYAVPKCSDSVPQMREIAPGHFCACHVV